MKILLLIIITQLAFSQLKFKSDFERNVFNSWTKAHPKAKIKFDSKKTDDYQDDKSGILHKISFKNEVVLMRRLLQEDSFLDSHLAFLGGRLLYILETYNKTYINQILAIYDFKSDKLGLQTFVKRKPKFESISFVENDLNYKITIGFKGQDLVFETPTKSIHSTERFYLPLEEQRFANLILSNQISKTSITFNNNDTKADFGLYRGYSHVVKNEDLGEINFKGNTFEPTRSQQQFLRLFRTKNQSINRLARQFEKLHVTIKTIYKPSKKTFEGREAISQFLTNMFNGYEIYAFAAKQDREELATVLLIKEPHFIFYHQVFINRRFEGRGMLETK